VNVPYRGAIEVTPDDDAVLVTETRGISVHVTGAVAVQMFDGSIVTIPGLAIDVIHEISVVKVLETGTEATGIIAYF
jgi:uncharacterized YccA/Bax inhibitor family protein